MENTIIPYDLPEIENHSFFYINQHISPLIEAKLHKHDAWELIYVIHGNGSRMAGDTLLPFTAGDVVLIPPSMLHHWDYSAESADKSGYIHYQMVAFSHDFVKRCIDTFPELRNKLNCVVFPTDALKFGAESSKAIKSVLSNMDTFDELGRLTEMFKLLPIIFNTSDHIVAGRPMNIEKDVRKMLKISAYVMAHYKHSICLDDIATEVGMNRSAFCTYFKRSKGITFSQFVVQYRLNTACKLLKESSKQVSEICYLVGFNDIPHFIRVFTHTYGISPSKYRKQFQ